LVESIANQLLDRNYLLDRNCLIVGRVILAMLAHAASDHDR